jgi:nitrite reductase/ring-hydroxylating ferredoxin subunit
MTERTRIGPASLLEEAPTTVTVGEGRYIVHRTAEGEPRLYSAVCPHQHGRVKVADETTFLCPNHRWEFDAETGECVSGGEGSLTHYDVVVEDGSLYAVGE